MTIPAAANSHAVNHVQSNNKSNVPPAKIARDYLTSNPDAEEQPFGKLVSQFAKGGAPNS